MFHEFLPSEIGGNNYFFTKSNIECLDESSFEKSGIALIVFEKSSLKIVSNLFSRYKNHFRNIELYDCGLLVHFQNIEQIILYFKSKSILPFIIGGDPDYFSNYALNHSKNIYHIGNQIAYTNTESASIVQNFVGYQRHLCEYDDILEIEAYHHNSMSLGKLRTYGYITEPILRDANLIFFNTNVFRLSDCMDNSECIPTGMNAEEVCQIFRYIGTSTDLDAIFVHDNNVTEQSGHLIAEAFWYFAEGYNIRMNDHPSQNHNISEFIVDSNEVGDMVFVKNNLTQRWWLKNQSQGNVRYLACAFEEYQSCIENEIPERLQNFLL